MIAHSGLLMYPHLLTVAGAAQASNLFPDYPGMTSPGTLLRVNYTLSSCIYHFTAYSNMNLKPRNRSSSTKWGKQAIRAADARKNTKGTKNNNWLHSFGDSPIRLNFMERKFFGFVRVLSTM
jgi:hypothetical protein